MSLSLQTAVFKPCLRARHPGTSEDCGTDNPKGIYTYYSDINLIQEGKRTKADFIEIDRNFNRLRGAIAATLLSAAGYEAYRAYSTRSDKKTSIQQDAARQAENSGSASSESSVASAAK